MYIYNKHVYDKELHKRTEVDSAIRIALQTDLDPDLGVAQRFRYVQQVVDARLVEYEFVVVYRVEGTGSHGLT